MEQLPNELEQLMREQAEALAGKSVGVQQLRPRHHAIMDYIVANPSVPYREVASHFHVTQAWLSTIIHSDCFQALLEEKHQQVFEETVLPLKDKLTGLAHRTIEKLGETVDGTNDGKLLNDIANTTLKSLGYGTNKGITVNAPGGAVQVGLVSDSVFEAAQQRIKARNTLPPPPPALEGEVE